MMDSTELAEPPDATFGASDGPAGLQRRLVHVWGPSFGIACFSVDGDPSSLWPVEQSAVERAVPRRRREFAAGRAAARAALSQLGLPVTAIPSAPDRSPVWPEGVVGSIAHNAKLCVAVVARRRDALALGIDVENDAPLEPALWPSICTERERHWLSTLPHAEQGRWVARFFCAKEAFYKWQYPQTGRMLDFTDVEIRFDADRQRFSVKVVAVGNAVHPQHQGQCLEHQGLLVAWVHGPGVATVRTD